MQFRLIRLRIRRRLRSAKKRLEALVVSTEKDIETYLFKRFERLATVRRFVFVWLGLVILLIGTVLIQNLQLSNLYQSIRPVPGGIYNEGVRGRFTNANPLYATSDADVTVSRLLFSSLFTYDGKGNMVGDLARDITVDTKGTTYTINLKPNLIWHDGQQLTSDDVVFTYKSIQNPDAQSPLQSSWQGIEVAATSKSTVTFKLPGVLASFPANLTNGIVPKHILSKLPPAELRSADFNTVRPIGSGPFVWQAIEVSGGSKPQTTQQRIALIPFANYHAGEPKLQKMVVQIFADQAQLINAFRTNRLTAMEGVNQVPSKIHNKSSVTEHSLPLRATTMAFFKTTSGVLADQTVRQALVQSADVPRIIDNLGYPARQVKEPLLQGQLAYDSSFTQPSFDLKAAKTKLTAAGWIVGNDGVRSKAGKKLTFTLTASDNHDYKVVSQLLQRQWRILGANVQLQLLNSSDFQNALTYHSYDAIIDGISIGVDPDVFVYWDSSQADIRSAQRLNLSEYSNKTADAALEAGRTRLDPSLRVIKYKPFLQAWQQDSPALGLYQPRVLYVTNGSVDGLSDQPINTAADRFFNVQNWQIRQAKVTN